MRMLQIYASILLLGLCQSTLAEPAINPDEGRPHVSWKDAHSVLGEMAFVSGKVIDVGSAGRIKFINFDAEPPRKFTAVVFGDNIDKFTKPLKETYVGKIVEVRGIVTKFKDQPQIVLTDPDQIKILDALPETTSPRDANLSPTPGKLVVATFNILNLFDDLDDPYHDDDTTPAKPREHMEHLTHVFEKLNADVVALQEVESRGYLERFTSVFLPRLGYEHVVHFEGNDFRGIDVCLVSRVPVGPVRSHRHLTFPGPNGSTRHFSRDVLAVTIEPADAEPLEIWIVHLKSNSGGREAAEPVRLAEANEVRRLLDRALAKDPNARILLLGDFNDLWGSPTIETIVGSGSTGMWSVASDLGGAMPDTYNTGQHHSMIDFILCSPAMVPKFEKGSCRILPGSPDTSGSDHNPVSATFAVP